MCPGEAHSLNLIDNTGQIGIGWRFDSCAALITRIRKELDLILAIVVPAGAKMLGLVQTLFDRNRNRVARKAGARDHQYVSAGRDSRGQHYVDLIQPDESRRAPG